MSDATEQLLADNPFADESEVAAATLHPDWTMRQYLGHKGVSRSRLWELLDTSPYEYDWEREHGEDRETDAMRLGTGIHTAVLEPHLLEKHYVVWDRKDENGKVKARNPRHKEYAAFLNEATARGQEVLSESEWKAITKVRDFIVSRKGVRQLLDNGKSEQSVTWRDPRTAEWVKARPDFLDLENRVTIDLKKADDPGMWIHGELNREKARREVLYRGYHMQGAMIHEGLSHAGAHMRDHWLLWVRSSGAPLAAMTRLQPVTMSEGHDRYREAIELYHKCKTAGEWPAKPFHIGDLPWETEL